MFSETRPKVTETTIENNILFRWEILNLIMSKQINCMIRCLHWQTHKYVKWEEKKENIYIYLKRHKMISKRRLMRLNLVSLFHIFSPIFIQIWDICTWMLQRASNSPCLKLTSCSVERNLLLQFYSLSFWMTHTLTHNPRLSLGIILDFQGMIYIFVML